jgi:archaellum component FlaC
MDQSQQQQAAGKKAGRAEKARGPKAPKEAQKDNQASEEHSTGSKDASKDKAGDSPASKGEAAKDDAAAKVGASAPSGGSGGGFLAALRGRAPGKESAGGSGATLKKRGGASGGKGGGDVPTVLLAVGSAYLTGRLLNTVMRALRGGAAPAPGSAGMERELARVQQKLRALKESEQGLQREKASWLQTKSVLQEERAAAESRHADTLRQMEATLEGALSRNNAEWGQKLKSVQDEANGKLAQVQAWQEELEKLRSEASQIRTLIEQVRSRSNSPSGRGPGQSPLSTGKENSLMSST